MLWFRWYHGTVSDAKLASIAKRINLPRSLVIACWAAVLENASANKVRGTITVTADELSVLVDCDTASAETVLAEFRARKMLRGNKVAAFQLRNPKGDDSYERVKKYREKKRVTETPVTRDSNATVTHETRLDKRRRDERRVTDEQKADDKSSEASPRSSSQSRKRLGRKSDVAAVVAPAIREHLWLGDEPPPQPDEKNWNMARELSVAKALMSKYEIDADDLAGAVSVARETIGNFDGDPVTLRIFNVPGQGDKLQRCLGVFRKKLAPRQKRKRGPLRANADEALNALR